MVANVGSRKVMEKAGLMHQRTWFYQGPDPIPGAELGDVEHALTLEQWLRLDRSEPVAGSDGRNCSAVDHILGTHD